MGVSKHQTSTIPLPVITEKYISHIIIHSDKGLRTTVCAEMRGALFRHLQACFVQRLYGFTI